MARSERQTAGRVRGTCLASASHELFDRKHSSQSSPVFSATCMEGSTVLVTWLHTLDNHLFSTETWVGRAGFDPLARPAELSS